MINDDDFEKVIEIYKDLLGEGYISDFASDYSSYALYRLEGYKSLLQDNKWDDEIFEMREGFKRFSKILALSRK